MLELDLSSEVSGWCVHKPLWSSVAQTSVYRGQIYLAPLAPVGKERPRGQELQQEVRKLQTEDFFLGDDFEQLWREMWGMGMEVLLAGLLFFSVIGEILH